MYYRDNDNDDNTGDNDGGDDDGGDDEGEDDNEIGFPHDDNGTIVEEELHSRSCICTKRVCWTGTQVVV